MIRFHLITLFPEACDAYLNASILGRARKEKKIHVDYQSPRDFVANKWGKVDEKPYGGGPGMVMTALPVVKAIKKSLSRRSLKKIALIWFMPGGLEFTNTEADKLAKFDDIVLVCGRYEGIDDRALKIMKTFGMVKKYAVGKAIYTGGELPSLAVIDAVTRRLPGVLGSYESVEERRTASREVYTRPETIEWEKKKYNVPKVLTEGDHAKIEAWKLKKPSGEV
jgi:tRNA (guanine37-N1)-methyltransferase